MYSPDGGTLAVSDAGDFTVRLWDVASGTLLHALPGSTHGWSLAFSPDGQWVAASDMLLARLGDPPAGEAMLWNVSDGTLVTTFPGNPYTGAVAFSPFGNLIAVAKSGFVDVWAAKGTWVNTP
jgi:WD40 repeat protein